MKMCEFVYSHFLYKYSDTISICVGRVKMQMRCVFAVEANHYKFANSTLLHYSEMCDLSQHIMHCSITLPTLKQALWALIH